MSILSYDQICYRILLTIGDSLDLKKMLSLSLSTYMKELSCTMGAIFLITENTISQNPLPLVYSIPRSIEKNASFNALAEDLMHSNLNMKDIIVREANDQSGIYYIMSLSDFGILILFKKKEKLPEELLQLLQPINQKLGTACKACLQNEALQSSSRRFMEMANLLPGIILELDRDYRIIFFNQRTQEIFKQIDSDEFLPQTIFDFFLPEDELSIIHLLQQAESGIPLISQDLWMKNSRGERFMVNLLLSPITTRNRINGFRGIAIDISARVKLEQDLIYRDKILHAITQSTQELLKNETLDTSMGSALEILGKAIDMDRVYYFTTTLDSQNNIQSISKKAAWNNIQFEPQTNKPEMQNIPLDAIEVFIEPLLNHQPFMVIVKNLEDTPTQQLLVEQNIQSLLVLPIYIRDIFWGFIGFDDCHKERKWSQSEQDLLKIFTTSVAETIERKEAEKESKQLYDNLMEDLEMAQKIQTYILPPWFKKQDPLLISSNYLPWDKIGGDLYDFIQISEQKFAVYVGDISGHGVQAALIMTAVKSVIHMIVSGETKNPDPAIILTKINKSLSNGLFYDNYMTMCYCLIDLEAMTISSLNAGHPPVMLINDGTVKLLDATGDIPLGWIEDYTYSGTLVQTVPFSQEDILCLYTDGVFDCANNNDEFLGIGQFNQLMIQELAKNKCIMLPHICYQTLADKGYTKLSDDFTFIALQLNPSLYNSHNIFCYDAKSQIPLIEPAAEACEQFILNQGFSEIKAMQVKLIVFEFFTNIIKHGLDGVTNELVLIEVNCTTKSDISITFRDRAKAWELPPKESSFENFFDALNLEAATSGRGIQMIYAITRDHSRIRYHRVNETTFFLDSE
jgi:phosphoserine phosphatase RsbU/P